ncbi:hypothetical protein Hanom_Chr07g00611121 [Helianthus anomalus]
MIDDLVKDIPKDDDDDILGLRNMIADTISRLSKGPEQRIRRMICKIDNPAYVAPENDAWRHDNSNSENEDDKMNEMVEKKLRYWFVKDGKRKRTPKISLVVPIPKEPTPKIVVKGIVERGSHKKTASKEPQSSLIDEPVVNPADLSQEGIDLTKVTLEKYIKITEESTAKDQSASVQVEGDTEKQVEDTVHEDSDDADDESTETEPMIDLATVGRGKVQMKKKPQKKRKGSDEENTTYTPTVQEKKKLIIKRKAVQIRVIPRNVRAKKGGASMPESQSGKSEKHMESSKGPEAVKEQHVEVQKNVGDDDYVEVRVSTPPPPPPKDQPIPERGEFSQPKNIVLPDMFEGVPKIRGELKDDFILGDEFDMFHDGSVKALEKKVSIPEKEKTKVEADRDELKRELEELMKVNEEIKTVMIKQAKKIKKMEGDVDDNAKLFDVLQSEISDLHVKNVKLNDINKTLII